MKKDAFSVRRDGGLSIKRYGLPNSWLNDIYHNLMRMKWRYFFVLFILAYLTINAIFATFYYLGGDNILNANPQSFWDAFLFSFQTSTTIGYGHFLPKTTYAHIIVMLDTISGILFVAIATGMAFTKFSRPTARVLFTKNMIISEMNGQKVLQFRLGNARTNEIVAAEVEAIMSRPEITEEGMSFRKIYDLELVRKKSPLFSLTWLVTHVIDESSPLYQYKFEELAEAELIFIISMTGIDDTFSQHVHNRKFYIGSDIVMAKQFHDVMGVNQSGKPYIDYNHFHKLIN